MATSFNGDVKLDAYLPTHQTLAGRQRKGIREPLGGCVHFEEHIRRALRRDILSASKTSIPAETLAASSCMRDMPADRLVPFWGARVDSLEQLISNCPLAQSKWGSCIRPEIRPSTGKFRTVVLIQLLKQHYMGSPRWMGQFPFGFPITGALSHRFTFEPEEVKFPRTPWKQLYVTASTRFRDVLISRVSGIRRSFGAKLFSRWKRVGCFPPRPWMWTNAPSPGTPPNFISFFVWGCAGGQITSHRRFKALHGKPGMRRPHTYSACVMGSHFPAVQLPCQEGRRPGHVQR